MLPITLILPTYNRASVLGETLPLYLRLPASEVIVVDDGSTDGTDRLVMDMPDPRLRLIRNPRRKFLPGARNVGIAQASQPFVLMGEDDVIMDESYVRTLHGHLLGLPSDIVAGRLIGMRRGETAKEALKRGDQERHERLIHAERLGFDYACRPATPMATPFLHACSMYRTEWARKHPYHEGYTGNALREESDFYLTNHAHGARIHFCGDAACLHMFHDYAGGCRTGLFRYTMSSLRNNHRFLGRHWRTIRAELGLNSNRLAFEFRLGMHHVRNNLADWLSVRSPRLHAWAKSAGI